MITTLITACAAYVCHSKELSLPRTAGTRNRNYPGLTLDQALTIPKAIQEGASGMTVSKLTLAGLVDSTPSSSAFREMLLASRAYGLTTGGVNAAEFGLTELGVEATGGDSEVEHAALRKAVMNIAPFREFLTQFNGKKAPLPPAFGEFLVKSASVPQEWVQDCMSHILADARQVGFLSSLKGGEYVDLRNAHAQAPDEEADNEDEVEANLSAARSGFAGGSLQVNDRDRETPTFSKSISPNTLSGK